MELPSLPGHRPLRILSRSARAVLVLSATDAGPVVVKAVAPEVPDADLDAEIAALDRLAVAGVPAPRVLDIAVDGRTRLLVVSLLPGRPLSHRLRAGRADAALAPAVVALAEAWLSAGVAHRALSAADFVVAGDRLAVTGFGGASVTTPATTAERRSHLLTTVPARAELARVAEIVEQLGDARRAASLRDGEGGGLPGATAPIRSADGVAIGAASGGHRLDAETEPDVSAWPFAETIAQAEPRPPILLDPAVPLAITDGSAAEVLRRTTRPSLVERALERLDGVVHPDLLARLGRRRPAAPTGTASEAVPAAPRRGRRGPLLILAGLAAGAAFLGVSTALADGVDGVDPAPQEAAEAGAPVVVDAVEIPTDAREAAVALLQARGACGDDVDCALALMEPGSPIATRTAADGVAVLEGLDRLECRTAQRLGDWVVATVRGSSGPLSATLVESDRGWVLRDVSLDGAPG